MASIRLRPSDLVLLAIAIVSIIVVIHNRSSRRRLPPGPPGIPIFGNLFQIPGAGRPKKFFEWSKQYGEIFLLRLGPGRNIVVLNSPEAVNELLTKRAVRYSSRPYSYVAHEIVSEKQRILLLPYEEQYKVARKSMAPSIGAGAMKNIRVAEELESRVLLKDLLDYGDRAIREYESPKPGPAQYVPENHWFFLIRRFTTSTIMKIVYGERITKLHGVPQVSRIYDVMSQFLKTAQPGRFLADSFPLLRLLPDSLSKWRREARELHRWEMELYGRLFEERKANVKSGLNRDCFVSNLLRARAEAGKEHAPGGGVTEDGWMRDKFIAYTAGSLLEAGSDTTASSILVLLLYLVCYPEVLKKAREEIDRVVGSERMPDWEDEDKLPYLIACIKESWRIRSVTNGAPHLSTEDDEYKGYFIPKGTMIIGNVWSLHMDPARWQDPNVFRPERFYTSDEPSRWRSGPEPQNRETYSFGWGKRFCQGSHIAQASLFIVIARIIWGLDMTPPTHPVTGKPMVPDLEDEPNTWSNETINMPKIFPLIWKARDKKRADMIEKSFEDAQHEWELLGLERDVR